ncbi:MAG TPA: cupredoxin domain-containing protein [Chloroflexota bacterium]|nr:cupredoxin domain-containing protein [Chloroflexota bacterium]
MRYRLVLLAAPAVLLVASACAPAATPAAGAALPPEQITVTGSDDFRFNPSTITVKAGQPLEVTFQNGSAILHDFTVQQGLDKPLVITEDGGRSATATVTFAKPGTYKFFCSQPGHDQLGMHGTITVQ